MNRSWSLTSKSQELDHRTSFQSHQSLKFYTKTWRCCPLRETIATTRRFSRIVKNFTDVAVIPNKNGQVIKIGAFLTSPSTSASQLWFNSSAKQGTTLTLLTPLATICTTWVNLQKLWILRTQYIFACCTNLTTNSDYLYKENRLVCLMQGMNSSWNQIYYLLRSIKQESVQLIIRKNNDVCSSKCFTGLFT